MKSHKRHMGRRLRQQDLPLCGPEQPAVQLPTGLLAQVRQLLQKVFLEIIDAKRAEREDVDE